MSKHKRNNISGDGKMRVVIVGAGAIGCLLGGRLAAKAKVLFLDANPKTVRAINLEGVHIEENDGNVTNIRDVKAVQDPSEIADSVNLVIFCVKSYATKDAAKAVHGHPAFMASLYLTLQNGLGNYETLAEFFDPRKILVGTTAQGATLIGPGRVRHGGSGPTYIGSFHKEECRGEIQKTVELFRRAGLEAYESEDVEKLLWEKLIVNVGINALTAITGLLNGSIVEIPEARDLCCEAVKEALAVASRKNILLPENYCEEVLKIAFATRRNRSSMGQDVDRGRKTEIDAINGAIVRLGEELQVPTPVNLTLTRLVKIIERTKREEGDGREKSNRTGHHGDQG